MTPQERLDSPTVVPFGVLRSLQWLPFRSIRQNQAAGQWLFLRTSVLQLATPQLSIKLQTISNNADGF